MALLKRIWTDEDEDPEVKTLYWETVKKPDGSYRVCVNFKDLNKITEFDPELIMSPDDIFPKLTGSQYV